MIKRDFNFDPQHDDPDYPAASASDEKDEAFACPRCGAVSHNPKDKRYGYCGACHQFFDDEAQILAEAAYRDDRYAGRQCDRCGKWYRGPAVYCSLKCALEDA